MECSRQPKCALSRDYNFKSEPNSWIIDLPNKMMFAKKINDAEPSMQMMESGKMKAMRKTSEMKEKMKPYAEKMIGG